MDNGVVQKIKKLLALSDSNNQHEAESAMLKAQELLAKHNISLADIKDSSPRTVVEDVTDFTFTKAKWKALLANIIAKNFKCMCFIKTRRTNNIVFLGTSEDVAVCKVMFEYAVDAIKIETKKMAYTYRKSGYSTNGLESDYALGFARGLNNKFEEQKTAHQEWGLVLTVPQEVINTYKNMEFKKTISPQEYRGNRDVYLEGIEAGKNFDINRLGCKN